MKKYGICIFISAYLLMLTGCANGQNSITDHITANTGGLNYVEISLSEKPSPEETTTEMINIDEEKSFVGTIIEEDTSYMLVEPDEEEEERNLTDRITVRYPADHYDFLYGEGRRVVIYYSGDLSASTSFEITTDDICTEGFHEFELSVALSETKEKRMILSNEEIESFGSFPSANTANLYYYGIEEAMIMIDDQTMTLAEALKKGKITLAGIIADANRDTKNGIVREEVYRDGGSVLYRYENYTIIKYHTLDGNRDVYIGSPDMDIEIADKV